MDGFLKFVGFFPEYEVHATTFSTFEIASAFRLIIADWEPGANSDQLPAAIDFSILR